MGEFEGGESEFAQQNPLYKAGTVETMRIVRDGTRFRTDGLEPRTGWELEVDMRAQALAEAGAEMIAGLASYVSGDHVVAVDNETFDWGYWNMQMRRSSTKLMEFWERTADWEDWQLGVERTLTYWRDQREVCAQSGLVFAPPLASRLIVHTREALTGGRFDAIRYGDKPPMSGWWFTGPDWDHDTSKITIRHGYHVAAEHPELAKYLGLAPGSWFRPGPPEEFGFEAEWASQQSGDSGGPPPA